MRCGFLDRITIVGHGFALHNLLELDVAGGGDVTILRQSPFDRVESGAVALDYASFLVEDFRNDSAVNSFIETFSGRYEHLGDTEFLFAIVKPPSDEEDGPSSVEGSLTWQTDDTRTTFLCITEPCSVTWSASVSVVPGTFSPLSPIGIDDAPTTSFLGGEPYPGLINVRRVSSGPIADPIGKIKVVPSYGIPGVGYREWEVDEAEVRLAEEPPTVLFQPVLGASNDSPSEKEKPDRFFVFARLSLTNEVGIGPVEPWPDLTVEVDGAESVGQALAVRAASGIGVLAIRIQHPVAVGSRSPAVQVVNSSGVAVNDSIVAERISATTYSARVELPVGSYVLSVTDDAGRTWSSDVLISDADRPVIAIDAEPDGPVLAGDSCYALSNYCSLGRLQFPLE